VSVKVPEPVAGVQSLAGHTQIGGAGSRESPVGVKVERLEAADGDSIATAVGLIAAAL
jgi:hypothetical protein